MSANSLNKSSEQRANEPSMEDILASIRRIIADDRMLPLTQRPPSPAPVDAPRQAPGAEPERPRATALDLQPERPAVQESPTLRVLPGGLPPAAAAPAPAPTSEDDLEDIPPVEAAERTDPGEARPFFAEPAEAYDEASEPLLSESANESVSSAFQSLATTVLLQNAGMVEQAMRDMLRPMLKQWLDENLPSIVERLVRVEIERVARGPRS